ncbi:MAG TPA: hypothetical protein VMQ76_01680 [Terracidiphilus sp.]|nr:hypothetical protein [Terracidiphilus sp.]
MMPSITPDQHERFDDALSDALCWLDGFVAAGGLYAPGTLNVLRAFRIHWQAGYATPPRPEIIDMARQIRNLAIQGLGSTRAVSDTKLRDIQRMAEALIDAQPKGTI